MITTTTVAPDVLALSATTPGPAGTVLPVNAFCLLGVEPTLVDTGLSPDTEEFQAALWDLVDPSELHWIVITHDDRDHTGSLRAILAQAPRATVVTNFVSMAKIGEDWTLPLDRLRLDIGDDVLEAFRPPTYDSPGTLAFHALRRNVCFSSDCLGAFVPSGYAVSATAEDVADYAAGAAMFASALSPWLHDLAPDRWRASVDVLRRRDVATLLSTHGLPVGPGLGRLLDMVDELPAGAAFVPPAQEFVDAMLAIAGTDH